MRTIAFASGKGGTGKTTLTALIAHLVSSERSIVVADCDVEASNLPIALHAQVTSFEPFEGGAVAVVDEARCTGCGACEAVCRFAALSGPEAGSSAGAYAVDPWACEGCGACVPACPAAAIALVPKKAGELFTASSTVGPVSFGQLGPGEDLSGRLVTEVRSRAKAMAQETAADLLLIDGPPGVGCPVTAAIADVDLLVAVTEPTLSGEHDLARLVVLARRLRVPVAVVLNKADLSASGAARIRGWVSNEGLEMLGEIPFDEGLAGVLGRFASDEGGEAHVAAMRGSAALQQINARLDETISHEPR